MKQITATLINLYHVCHRELWLHAHEIRMEHTSEIVAEGKLIGETAYDRRSDKYTQVELDGIKIDFYDPKNKVVHETKRGRAIEAAHRAQVQYYLYKLGQQGVEGASGLIEYPDLKKTEPVAALAAAEVAEIAHWAAEVQRVVALDTCPPTINKPFCKQCAYHDLCYIGEGE
jgi:CRISPR-associated exonuclease Cas4